MNNKELLDYIIKKFDGVLVDDYDTYHYKIDGKPYDIRFDSNRKEWSCSCPAFTFRHRWKKKYSNIIFMAEMVSEWLGNGLQTRLCEFESHPSLKEK